MRLKLECVKRFKTMYSVFFNKLGKRLLRAVQPVLYESDQGSAAVSGVHGIRHWGDDEWKLNQQKRSRAKI